MHGGCIHRRCHFNLLMFVSHSGLFCSNDFFSPYLVSVIIFVFLVDLFYIINFLKKTNKVETLKAAYTSRCYLLPPIWIYELNPLMANKWPHWTGLFFLLGHVFAFLSWGWERTAQCFLHKDWGLTESFGP